MTMKMAPVTKSGCADDVGNTVSSVDAGAAAGDATEADADADGDGDSDTTPSSVVAVQSLTRNGGREFSGSIWYRPPSTKVYSSPL